MILLAALAAGLLSGLIASRWQGRPYRPPALRSTWLILVGFAPQLVIAYLPGTHDWLPDRVGAVGISASVVFFLLFGWLNRSLPGMPVLLAGLLLNLVVMWANGGWMPISPETASRVLGHDVRDYIALGSRFGQKDILLMPQETRLGLLSDRFTLPAWSPYQVAFSAGDVLIALGVFWLLASPPFKDRNLNGSNK